MTPLTDEILFMASIGFQLNVKEYPYDELFLAEGHQVKGNIQIGQMKIFNTHEIFLETYGESMVF